MSGYRYESFEPGLWTVGYSDSNGKWQPESDHSSAREAAAQVAYLNGGPPPRRGSDGIAVPLEIRLELAHLRTALDMVGSRFLEAESAAIFGALDRIEAWAEAPDA